mmetsp:Transcript_50113/g.98102  ORF Transcript_50113/g.98102 Transcript_50113/m.98102 type:complete len:110 (+) Transcript_50113:54-383(+)
MVSDDDFSVHITAPIAKANSAKEKSTEVNVPDDSASIFSSFDISISDDVLPVATVYPTNIDHLSLAPVNPPPLVTSQNLGKIPVPLAISDNTPPPNESHSEFALLAENS